MLSILSYLDNYFFTLSVHIDAEASKGQQCRQPAQGGAGAITRPLAHPAPDERRSVKRKQKQLTE